MALEGTLRDFSLADIFQLIGLQRKTGVLSLRSHDDVVTVSFVDGKVVAADSLNDRLEDRLGQILLKTGAISRDNLDAALKEQMETLQRLGRVLIRRGAIQRDRLRDALQKQTLQIIFRVFRWQDGDYNFSQEVSVDYDAEIVVPITAESILMEGARMLDEWPIIERRLPDRDILLAPTRAAAQVEVEEDEHADDLVDIDLDGDAPLLANASGRVRITRVEDDVLDLVDDAATVEEVLAKSPHGEFDTCKALYTLLTRGLLREATRQELAQAARAAAAAGRTRSPVTQSLPWLPLLLLPLLVASLLLARQNPLNPLVGPGPKLGPRLAVTFSRARLRGLWETLHARAFLVGSYPETLTELVSAHSLPSSSLTDPWGRPYHYVLREHSLLLSGTGPSGVPDAYLIFSQDLGYASEEVGQGKGITLLTP